MLWYSGGEERELNKLNTDIQYKSLAKNGFYYHTQTEKLAKWLQENSLYC